MLPTVVSVVAVVGSFGASRGETDRRAADWFMVVLLLIGSVSLYWLRSRPIPVLWATVVSTLVYMLMQYAYGPVIFSFVIAVFTAIRLGHRAAGWSAIVTLYAGHVLGRIALGIHGQGIYQILLVGTCFVVLGFLAELFRLHRERVMAAKQTRREEELRKAGEERLRIAQELHDVVAHHISLINVQASTALHLADRQPEQAVPALAAIKEASKEALVELRSIVGILRQSDEAAPRQPVVGIGTPRQLGQPYVDGRVGGAHADPWRSTATTDRPGSCCVPHHPGVADQRSTACKCFYGDSAHPVRRARARSTGG